MSRSNKQRGFTLVSAIFLLVVLALLGAYMVTIGGVQRATTSQALMAARVYYGAKSGLEWAIQRATAPQVTNNNTASGLCSSASSFNLTGNGLEGISVTVTCTRIDYPPKGGKVYSVFYITSLAKFGSLGSPDYSQRLLEATVTNCTPSQSCAGLKI